MNTNPFDRVNLGYDGLFGPRTMFYHLQPASGRELMLEVQVPVLDQKFPNMKWVEYGTVTVVVFGFLWVCLESLAVVRGNSGRKGGRPKKRD